MSWHRTSHRNRTMSPLYWAVLNYPHPPPQGADACDTPQCKGKGAGGLLECPLQEPTESSRMFPGGLVQTLKPGVHAGSATAHDHAARCQPGLGRSVPQCKTKGQIKSPALEHERTNEKRGSATLLEWGRGERKSIFKNENICFSRTMKCWGGTGNTRVSASTESSHEPGCVLASIPAHPRILGQTNSWLGRYVWEASRIFQLLKLCPELLNQKFPRSCIRIRRSGLTK